ncbi:MAG: VCBS repeat-containing protein [Rhodobacteraceae bacterium]|nr:VCBS repeat-containing protein [Paracoccaceae bacterium]
MDGDGQPEVVIVQSDVKLGAALVIYHFYSGELVKTATPNIGTKFRWLAPVGIADFNGDGNMDVAYVDRPHLAKILRVWTYRDGALHEIATLQGVTNHLIGQPQIFGGVRDCGDGLPEMIMADSSVINLVAVRLEGGFLRSRSLGRFIREKMTEEALQC